MSGWLTQYSSVMKNLEANSTYQNHIYSNLSRLNCNLSLHRSAFNERIYRTFQEYTFTILNYVEGRILERFYRFDSKSNDNNAAENNAEVKAKISS